MEQKLLDCYRACDEQRKYAILETAKLCLDLSQNPPSGNIELVSLPMASDLRPADPDNVQTSNQYIFPVRRMHYNAELLEYQKTRSIVDISKRADGNVPLRYSLTLSDIAVLSDLLFEDRTGIKPFGIAFDFGFVMGNRATRRGKVKAL